MASQSKHANMIRHHQRLDNNPDNHQANPLDNHDHNNAEPQRIIGQAILSMFRNVSKSNSYFTALYKVSMDIRLLPRQFCCEQISSTPTPPHSRAHTATVRMWQQYSRKYDDKWTQHLDCPSVRNFYRVNHTSRTTVCCHNPLLMLIAPTERRYAL